MQDGKGSLGRSCDTRVAVSFNSQSPQEDLMITLRSQGQIRVKVQVTLLTLLCGQMAGVVSNLALSSLCVCVYTNN